MSKYDNLQETELRTLHYLGIKYVVLKRKPVLKVKVSICTKNYDGGDVGISCKLIFTCPPKYPKKPLTLEIVCKRNFPNDLEKKLMDEYKRTLVDHQGLQMMMPIATRAQVILNSAASLVSPDNV